MLNKVISGPVLISKERLFRELATEFLSRHTGEAWTPVSKLDDLTPTSRDIPSRVLLWDVMGMKADAVVAELPLHKDVNPELDIVALVRFRAQPGDEGTCLSHGIRGFFYQHESSESFLLGIRALNAGQLWLPRKAAAALRQSREALTPPPLANPWTLVLSRRERQVLSLVGRGKTNKEIGIALGISPHTVKAHLFKIYKKINVSNRMEASIWLMEQLG